ALAGDGVAGVRLDLGRAVAREDALAAGALDEAVVVAGEAIAVLRDVPLLDLLALVALGVDAAELPAPDTGDGRALGGGVRRDRADHEAGRLRRDRAVVVAAADERLAGVGTPAQEQG